MIGPAQNNSSRIIEIYEEALHVPQIAAEILHKKYKIDESDLEVERIWSDKGYEILKYSDALRAEIRKNYTREKGNSDILLKRLNRDTPLRPSDQTVKRVMRELGLEIIARDQKAVKADRAARASSKKLLGKRQKNAKDYWLCEQV